MTAQRQKAKALLAAIAGYTQAPAGATRPASQDRPILLGTVDPSYSGGSSARVTFDGESTLSTKAYVTAAVVFPSSRVYLLPIGKSYVIGGVIGGSQWPVGSILEGRWAAAPAGFVIEDGSPISRTTFAALFAVIGTRFGAGNGTTTFNIPDSRGRVTVNKGGTAFTSMDAHVGEEAHTLVKAEIPPLTVVQHLTSVEASGYGLTTGGGFGNRVSVTGVADGVTLTDGGSGAHNNIQPSDVILRAIKF